MRDVSRLCGWMLVAAIALPMSSQGVRAELPPSAYAQMQNAAGELLQIEVLKVDGEVRRGENEESHITMTAKVVCLARSASGLTPGATITIAYSTVLNRPRGWAGPSRIGILEPGAYVAYLDKSGDIYTPAARVRSFIAARQRGNEPSAIATLC
jgi:hypothetical protein